LFATINDVTFRQLRHTHSGVERNNSPVKNCNSNLILKPTKYRGNQQSFWVFWSACFISRGVKS